MKRELLTVTNWMNNNLRRAKLIAIALLLSLSIGSQLAPRVVLAGPIDGGPDAVINGPIDGGPDATINGPIDGGPDAAINGPIDGGPDATINGPIDGGPDAGGSV